MTEIPVESHPFHPFLPENAKILFLGSFPPQEKRWSIPFFYPNYRNDFWYMIGLLWFADRYHFVLSAEKKFDLEKIVQFCKATGFAMFDTATEVRRLKDNASDKFLEIVTPTDLGSLLQQIPQCGTIVATGQKAVEIICGEYGCTPPPVGGKVTVDIPVCTADGSRKMRNYTLYRMPSTSRAYPLALEKKAEAYAQIFRSLELL